ncbi:hypothetical protein BJF79_39510 [Actinomadura sp. CNU-125]|uniref:hypothetical protein n=1 Tax=Actinomadura sp. CNU-125 TaxID=1904961 RepID=UPI00095D9C66|nr:hypothetical protein [Actinomadura sp. CNU-125]OLT30238.1 hypothetical protein BJF79_39510 [Actinomadura sp. CNU-125]
MRAYLAVVSKARNRRISPHILESAGRAAAEAIPVPTDRLTPSRWTSGDGATVLLAWSNEPEHRLLPRPLTGGDERVLGYTGYLADPDIAEKELLKTADPAAAVESMGGVFAVFRAHRDGFEAATSIARVCPVYFTETTDFCFIGSRALLVHLTARAAETGLADPPVAHDVMALQPMIRHGFFTNDDTPFAGVRALPADAVLTAAPGRGVAVRGARRPGGRADARGRAGARGRGAAARPRRSWTPPRRSPGTASRSSWPCRAGATAASWRPC